MIVAASDIVRREHGGTSQVAHVDGGYKGAADAFELTSILPPRILANVFEIRRLSREPPRIGASSNRPPA